jgi:predicted adenylyl cyclase CyaB
MPSNVEIKARVIDLEQFRVIAKSLADTSSTILNQEDIFFVVPHARLKLRILAADRGELILYHRPNMAGPKTSTYRIAPTSDPIALKEILSAVLPVLGVIKKRRELYLVGQTRVHLDQVEGLGDFVELEVVLHEGQSADEGTAIARDLMNRLQIADEQLVDKAYIDLLA